MPVAEEDCKQRRGKKAGGQGEKVLSRRREFLPIIIALTMIQLIALMLTISNIHWRNRHPSTPSMHSLAPATGLAIPPHSFVNLV